MIRSVTDQYGKFTALFVALVVVVAGLLAVDRYVVVKQKGLIKTRIDSALAEVDSSVTNWINSRRREVAALASSADVVADVRELITLADQRSQTLLSSDAQANLRARFRPYLQTEHIRGYFVIAPNGVSLASSRDENVGTQNLLMTQADLLTRVWAGDSLVTKMQASDVSLGDTLAANLTIFAVSPVVGDGGDVIALFALRLNPQSEVLPMLGFDGPDREVHALGFDKDGHILSIDVQIGQSANAVESAVFVPSVVEVGSRGESLKAYLNAQGEPVVGGWRWDERIGFGYGIEISRDAAFGLTGVVHVALLLAGLGAGTALVGLFLFQVIDGQKSEQQRSVLETVLSATGDLNVVVDESFRIILANTAIETMLGIPQPKSVGLDVCNYFSVDGAPGGDATRDALENMAPFRTSQSPLRAEVLGQEGRRLPVSLQIQYLTSRRGVVRYLLVVHDYSDVVAQEERLTAALATAEASDRAKSAFLSTISHELRSPLISVTAALELVSERITNEDDARLMAASQRAAKLLLGIIDEILDFSRLEADKLSLNLAPVQLHAVLSDVTEILRWQAWQSDSKLVPFCAPDLPVVHADGLRLRQILLNLTGNAIKFSSKLGHPGEVSVDISGDTDELGVFHATLRVCDNGIGMTPETIDQLFTPFLQADTSITRRYGGTGLGLSITKRLVEMMHGAISVKSTEGEGSEFEVVIPLRCDDRGVRGPNSQDAPRPLDGISIGYTGQADQVSHAVISYATHAGADITRFDDFESIGPLDQSGLDLVLLSVPQYQPNLGEQARMMQVPILQVTAFQPEGGKSFALDLIEVAGLDYTVLIEKIALLTGRDLPRWVNDMPVSRQNAGRVLVVEDDPLMRNLLVRQLASFGLEPFGASNGEEALLLWSKLRPGMVLSDCHMPFMDGFELAHHIRAEERDTGGIKMPIIAVTADVSSDIKQRGKRAGVDDYLSKPVQAADLHSVIERFFPDVSESKGH